MNKNTEMLPTWLGEARARAQEVAEVAYGVGMEEGTAQEMLDCYIGENFMLSYPERLQLAFFFLGSAPDAIVWHYGKLRRIKSRGSFVKMVHSAELPGYTEDELDRIMDELIPKRSGIKGIILNIFL
jgi:hypothetical protein